MRIEEAVDPSPLTHPPGFGRASKAFKPTKHAKLHHTLSSTSKASTAARLHQTNLSYQVTILTTYAQNSDLTEAPRGRAP